MSTSRSPLLRGRRPLSVALVILAIATALPVSGVLARFTDSAAVTGNAFTTGTWVTCTAGSQTVQASADAWTDQASPSQNQGTDSNLFVMSKSGSANRRSFVRFTLPALPAGCAVTSSTLRLYNNSPASGRTIQAYQAAAAWVENTITWTNQPAATGTAATSVTTATAGWQTWTVTSHVQAMYSGSNNGFHVRDMTENNGGGPQQNYISRESGSNRPELVVNWG